jgi:hypothetical protein
VQQNLSTLVTSVPLYPILLAILLSVHDFLGLRTSSPRYFLQTLPAVRSGNLRVMSIAILTLPIIGYTAYRSEPYY